MYVYCTPEDSEKQFERMLADAESICQALGFTYRVNTLCTGDLGFAAAKTYDIEAWLPGEEGAAAVADVLFGNVSPGGKLPISFPRGS